TYSDAYNGVRFGIWQIIYLIWIGLLCIGFICGEYWYNYRNGVFFWNTSDPEDNQHRIESLINGYNKLPDITWDPINKNLIIQSNNDAEKLFLKKRNIQKKLHRPISLAVKVDQINAKTSFNNKISRVAIHSHSKFAATKLATMAIAKLLKNDHL
ncbi:20219_t:CDS:2, partial [Entrophospora sp. SA101]